MTLLRRYLFGLLAVCTAFALGIALGGGPLQGRFVDTGASATTGAGRTQLNRHAGLRLAGALGAAVGSHLLQGQLTGRSVAVFALPGVSRHAVQREVSTLHEAGGLTPVVAHLSAYLIDSRKKTYVDSVAAGSLRHHPEVGRGVGHDTYARIAAVIARAYLSSGRQAPFDKEAQALDAELQGAKIVSLEQTPVGRANLLVVLAPQAPNAGAYAKASRLIVTSLVKALAREADGAVLVSPPTHGAVGSAAEPRFAAHLSTVNVFAGTASRVVVVYALLAAANGDPGSFGVFGNGVRLPPGLRSAAG